MSWTGKNCSFGGSSNLRRTERKGPEGHRSACMRNRETPAGFKPNQAKPSGEKFSNVAF